MRGWGAAFNALNAKFLVLIEDCYTNLFTGEAVAPSRLDAAAFARLIDTTHRVARIARDDYGMELVFHPHAQTHVEYEDQIEAFLNATDPQLVSIVLDTGHHSYCGGDVVGFMRKHHARIPYLHLKSVDKAYAARRSQPKASPSPRPLGCRYVRRAVERRGGLCRLPRPAARH